MVPSFQIFTNGFENMLYTFLNVFARDKRFALMFTPKLELQGEENSYIISFLCLVLVVCS